MRNSVMMNKINTKGDLVNFTTNMDRLLFCLTRIHGHKGFQTDRNCLVTNIIRITLERKL